MQYLISMCDFGWFLPWFLPFILGLGVGFFLWAHWRSRYRDLDSKHVALNQQWAKSKEELQEINQQKVKLEGDIKLMKNHKRELDQHLIDKNIEIESLKNQIAAGGAAAAGSGKMKKLEAERAELILEVEQLKSTLSAMEKDVESADKSSKESSSSFAPTGKFSKIAKDDLKIIEGLGPKIEKLLHKAGITSWSILADTSADKIKQILSAAGSRFGFANPKTWPQQAKLADEGKWYELEKLQDKLDGGK